jgi:hypothetical protein
MKDRQLLEELVGESCSDGRYCFLKELMLNNGLGDYMVLQLKMMEKYQYITNTKNSSNLDLNEASMRFIERGYAAKYAELYKEEKNRHKDSMARELFK